MFSTTTSDYRSIAADCLQNLLRRKLGVKDKIEIEVTEKDVEKIVFEDR